ncbi:IS66 family insertion sequence element accessory protein TnpA [Paenibacillus senegalensis]|uniref:IS66 family insertion sequence element accessory protein TnpA n=1 Tax=Paenibacillus senegalensis TaxID=1465766 RepID=UPI000289B87A|nr:hypothetical protein [Paenibacillus senegalensis]
MNKNEKANYWREQVSEYRASGLTMKAWCEKHHIASGQMKYWIRKLGLRQRSRRAAAPNWIEVTPVPASASSLIVRVGAAEIEVAAGFDTALLKQVVQTLGDPS